MTSMSAPRKDVEDLEHPANPELSSTVRRGVIWSLANTALLKFASIFISAVVARILDPRAFGIFAVAATVYGIVFMIGELGLSACLLRADLDLDSLAPTMVTVSVGTSVIQAGAMFAFARPIAVALGSGAAASPIRVMALVVIIVGIFAVPSAQLMRDFRQEKIFLAEVVSFVPSTIALVLLAKSGNGAMAFAWSRVIGQLVSGCVLFFAVPKKYHPGMARNALSVLFSFGMPLGFANIVNYVLLNVDYALIGHLLGAVSLGTYVLAFNVASWPASLLGNMINNVSLPAFSRVKSDHERLTGSIASALRWLCLVAMPMSALSIALARPLVLTIYGPKWAGSAPVLSVLALYGAISIICVLFANMLAGLGRTKVLVVMQVLWLGALVPGMVLGVRWGGIAGAAVAHVAIIVPIVLPIYVIVLKRATRVRLVSLLRAALPAISASLGAAAAARATASQFANPVVELAAGMVAGGLAYVVVIAPVALALLDERRRSSPVARHILGIYNCAGRLIGLPVGAQPKHSSRRVGQESTGPVSGQVGPQSVGAHMLPVRSAEEQAAALALLISLAKPYPGSGL
jgi:lipopolysaccharide exporter